MMALSGLVLVLDSGPVWAAGQHHAKHTIAIPAGPLSESLIALAVQTGASIGLPGKLPARHVAAVHGAMSVDDALKTLLKGSGFKAVQTGPMAWRLVSFQEPKPAPKPRPPKPTLLPPSPPTPAPPLPDIVVTASKSGSVLQTMPVSVEVLTGDDLQRSGAVPGTNAVAALSDSMALSNLGPGRNRAFLRGIADSPFNGVTQSTVAIEVDDARVTFNAPDPDLRLVDIAQIELLEGPQGPLHGTGALGGVYRILPNSARTDVVEAELVGGTETTSHGGAGYNGSAMINLPLATDRLGLRLVGYGARDGGWIDRGGAGGTNSNATRVLGGRASMRLVPAAGWSVDLSGIVQMLHAADSQYADVPGKTYARNGTLAEPHDNDFLNGRLTVRGRIGSADLVSVTSWTWHEVDTTLDASPSAGRFGLSAPVLFEDNRVYTVRNQEVRLSGGDRFRWMAGLSYVWASTELTAEVAPQNGNSLIVGRLHQINTERAVFGELSAPLIQDFRIDVGARLFRASVDDELESAGTTVSHVERRTSVSPSASLSWSPDRRRIVYVRVASAYRPSGLSPFVPVADATFESDELQSMELGGRYASSDGHVSLGATAYLANWSHIQSDYLLPNGLIATRNSGTGQIFGIETRIKRVFGRVSLEAGLMLQHARLEKPEPGLILPDENRLPIVPGIKGHLVARYAVPVKTGSFDLVGQFNHIGRTQLSLDPALNRHTAARETIDFDARRSWNGWSLAVGAANVLNSHRNSFAFGNQFALTPLTQSTPLRPRTIYLSLGRSWH